MTRRARRPRGTLAGSARIGAVIFFAAVLSTVLSGGLWLTGCAGGSSARSPSAVPPESAVQAPQHEVPKAEASKTDTPKAEAAKTEPPPSGDTLKDLEKKIRPPVGDKPPAAAPDPKAIIAEVEEALRDWIEAIDAGKAEVAREALVTDAELQVVASEGLRSILVSSMLPENRNRLNAILEAAKGKGIEIETWEPGQFSLTQKPQYRESFPMVSKSTLDVSAGGKSFKLQVSHVKLGGRWKIFQLNDRD